MVKISKKQKEVMVKLYNTNTYIIYMKGLNPHCFMHDNLSYTISTATLFRLEELKLIEEKNIEWNASDYFLSDFGKEYARLNNIN